MKYKVTLNGRTYEVEVEAGKAMLLDEYEAIAPAAPAAALTDLVTKGQITKEAAEMLAAWGTKNKIKAVEEVGNSRRPNGDRVTRYRLVSDNGGDDLLIDVVTQKGGKTFIESAKFSPTDKTKLTPARILTGYVVAGVLLGAVGLYEPFAQWAGAGATVPLTGFGNLLAKGVREAIAEDGFLGIFTGGLKATAGGITAAITAGLTASLIFKAKDKS